MGPHHTMMPLFVSIWIEFFPKPNNIADLQERIREEIGKITPQMLHNVRDETYHRLGCCQQAGYVSAMAVHVDFDVSVQFFVQDLPQTEGFAVGHHPRDLEWSTLQFFNGGWVVVSLGLLVEPSTHLRRLCHSSPFGLDGLEPPKTDKNIDKSGKLIREDRRLSTRGLAEITGIDK
ncbi:hypothetical protein NQ318_008628 [Aromia moschata]|uniref:Uncharacterized protein n=1 Tax=Aromia moschata TaxID=1265417 RepID=A0AAV8YW36_9CUCU|nr:hypothetical protein NQ318_008628 [Aromia moschata]